MSEKPKRPRHNVPQQHGILVLHKPSGPTSTDCLNDVKFQLSQKKIGHAGTLDPLAEGVLIALLGKGTKLAPFLSGREKTYLGGLRLGVTTDTYDSQGQIVSEVDPSDVTVEQVEAAVQEWLTLEDQEVPAYSAAKHKGKPLYELARAGKEVPVKRKLITITAAETLDISLPDITFRVTCSAGTYIRSLVHSLGKRIGCGAMMTSLVREASHPFTLDQSHDLQTVLNEPDQFAEKVLSLADALPDWPRAILDENELKMVKNGMRLSTNGQAAPGAQAMFLDEEGNAVALAQAVESDGDVRWSILRGLW